MAAFLKRLNIWSKLFIMLFLLFRATDEERWIDRYLGGSQTMLYIRHWNEEG